MLKFVKIILVPLLLLGVCSCAKSTGQVPGPPLGVSEGQNVAIPDAAMGKEYMMSTSTIAQAGAATGHGGMGRIVMFERYDDGIDLYESTVGQVVTNDLPARRLLATFPIVADGEGETVIDFNAGMRRLIYEGWYEGADARYDAGVFERSAELPQARVFGVTVEEATLVIRQTVQARNREQNQNRETRMEVRYFFTPYEESEFVAKEMNPVETRYARFWETQPSLELTTGRETVKMGRFDESESIEFHYSANTPPDFEQAVLDGILYWNRAFGKEIVKAKKAPDGVSAPDARYNVVQWVPWDDAGFAYADALLDPRTGEILHGQAFMTSVFGIGGKARARALIRAMVELVEEAEKAGDDADGDDEHGFFGGRSACQINPVEFAKQLSAGLEALLADPELTDAAVLTLSQDYVREVVAHEVGHVIGLRHNFAGSLAATMSPVDLDAFIKDYIAGEDLTQYEDQTTSSSMMEYSGFKAAVFLGWKMKKGLDAEAHDRGTIRWGYFDDKEVVEKKMLFGTDPDARIYGDVIRFDYGVDPLLAAYDSVSSEIRQLPNSIIESFIRARAPQDARDRQPLETVDLSVDRYAKRIGSSFGTVLKWFKSETRSRRVENDFDFIGELNEDARYKAHWDYLNKQLEALGGVYQVSFSYLPVDLKLKTKEKLDGVEVAPKIEAKKLSATLKTLLATDNYSTFVGLDDETYTWTEEEKAIIQSRGELLFGELEEAVLLNVLKQLEEAPRDLGVKATGGLADDDAVAKLEERIIDLAKAVVLAKDKDARIRGKVDKALMEVVGFKYDHETRLAAAKALNDKTGSFASWAKEPKQKLHEELKKAVDEALNVAHFKEFDDALLSRSLREWYLQQQEILKMLPPKKKPAEPKK